MCSPDPADCPLQAPAQHPTPAVRGPALDDSSISAATLATLVSK